MLSLFALLMPCGRARARSSLFGTLYMPTPRIMSVISQLATCMLLGTVIRAKRDPVSSKKLCPVGLLAVRLFYRNLQSCRMLTVVMMSRWPDDSALRQ